MGTEYFYSFYVMKLKNQGVKCFDHSTTLSCMYNCDDQPYIHIELLLAWIISFLASLA